MTSKRKVRIAARLAAKNCTGISQRSARELINFWIDAEVVSPEIPVEALAAGVANYMAELARPCTT